MTRKKQIDMQIKSVMPVTAMQLKTRMMDLLGKLRDASQHAERSFFLPEMIRSLEAMVDSIDVPKDRRTRMAGALGRLVTEDYAFSESALGREILELADGFASLECRYTDPRGAKQS